MRLHGKYAHNVIKDLYTSVVNCMKNSVIGDWRLVFCMPIQIKTHSKPSKNIKNSI